MHEILKMENIKIFKKECSPVNTDFNPVTPISDFWPQSARNYICKVEEICYYSNKKQAQILFIYLFGKNIHLDLLRRWIKGA